MYFSKHAKRIQKVFERSEEWGLGGKQVRRTLAWLETSTEVGRTFCSLTGYSRYLIVSLGKSIEYSDSQGLNFHVEWNYSIQVFNTENLNGKLASYKGEDYERLGSFSFLRAFFLFLTQEKEKSGITMGTVDADGNYEANENFLGEVNGHDIAEQNEANNQQDGVDA